MNKTKTISLSIAVVLILIVFGVLGFNKKIAKAPETSTNVPATSTVGETSSSPSSSIVSLNPSSSVTFVIGTPYQGPSFSLIYPQSWTYFPAADFSIDTFGGKYPSDGTLPAGGAEVDIATTTAYASVQSIMDAELISATNLTTSTVTVDKIVCQKASFQANYAPGATSKDISLYCSRGSELWKIYFSYGINDPAPSAHISDFNGMLTSMKFLP